MTVFGGIVLFASFWFLALFIVLPFGQFSQDDAGEIVPGTPPGAPHRLRLGRKLILATVIAIIAWLAMFWLVTSGVITRDDVTQWDRLIRRD